MCHVGGKAAAKQNAEILRTTLKPSTIKSAAGAKHQQMAENIRTRDSSMPQESTIVARKPESPPHAIELMPNHGHNTEFRQDPDASQPGKSKKQNLVEP